LCDVFGAKHDDGAIIKGSVGEPGGSEQSFKGLVGGIVAGHGADDRVAFTASLKGRLAGQSAAQILERSIERLAGDVEFVVRYGGMGALRG